MTHAVRVSVPVSKGRAPDFIYGFPVVPSSCLFAVWIHI